MSTFAFGNGSKEKLYGNNDRPAVHPMVSKLAVKALGYSTVDFSIIDGRRLTADQQKVFAAGASALDGINQISDHQRGLAIDIYPCVKRDGKRVNMYDIDDPYVVTQWLEVYRAFMRAAMKLGLVLEFGLAYNISGGRDWPHISIKGITPTDYSDMSNIS